MAIITFICSSQYLWEQSTVLKKQVLDLQKEVAIYKALLRK